LVAAIVNSSWEVVRKFLNETKIANLDEAIIELQSRPKFALTRKSSLDTPWQWAIYNGLVHLSKHLLMQLFEGEIDAQERHYGTALYTAALRGHEKVVQMLLDARADVNALGGGYSTALYTAALRGHEKVVQKLLDAGADVNARGGQYGTALQAASVNDHEKVVQMLLDARADVNAQRGMCGSALQAASVEGHEKVVQMLRAAGAR
jgi:ankyrin repeat protein